eukprot:7626018-Prorocentrum_lima.AAC.1
MDAPGLLLALHSKLLRKLAGHHGIPFQGLAQAARHSRKVLPAQLVKTLVSLDLVAAWVRHATLPKCSQLDDEVQEHLNQTRSQGSSELHTVP